MSGKSIYEFTAKDIDGNEVSLEKYKGNVVIIVNVASKCGLTKKNYTELKEIFEKYKDAGLRIAAFPCNQFGKQEPGSEADIKSFVNNRYEFEPDLFSKIKVNGEDAHPLYKFMKKEQAGTIKWNFTKFLIDREGHVVKRFAPKTEPNEMVRDIEAVLAGSKL